VCDDAAVPPTPILLQERITELEAEAVGERPWQLKGEVAAATRPLNSALEVRQSLAAALVTRALCWCGCGLWPVLWLHHHSLCPSLLI
jgi:predicted anti-sigma-YlaC factor YlaD